MPSRARRPRGTVRPALVVRACAQDASLKSFAEVPAVTPESTALAKEIKKRGFAFVGPTTAYALMQATGMVDDHLRGCHVAIAPRSEAR